MPAFLSFLLRSTCVLLAIVVAHSAFAADPLPGPRFVGFAQEINDFEIAAGRLALAKSSNPAIRAFAQRTLTEHETAASALSHSRSEAGITLAPTPGGREPRHARILDRLAVVEGVEFDAVYASAQLAAHVETVDQFGAYAQGGDNGGLRRFAQEMLPKLRLQLDHARRLPAP
jgi:putative membrane protein